MKRLLLSLLLVAFLAGPILSVPEAQAVTQSKSHPVKPKAVKPKAAKPKAVKPRIAKAKIAKFQKTGSVSRHKAQPKAIPADFSQPDELHLRASAALVVDQKSGEALYAKNTDVPTSIASITKLMTAMVTLDAGLPMIEEIAISEDDVDRLKGTGSRLALGIRLTREELIYLALIASENRAASALSRAYPGGQRAFVAAMNRKALEIGMTDSCFVDGTGLNSNNRSTAADLVKMVEAAYSYPLIREITSTGTYDVSLPGTKVLQVRKNGRTQKVSRAVQRHMVFNNTNCLTRSRDWEIGVSKTGYINEAGHCLVMQSKIAEQEVIIILLDSNGKWGRIGDAERIRKWLEQDSRMASQRGSHS